MKDYIITVEETYFDATKFEIGGLYLVIYKGEEEEEFKCILTTVSKSKMHLKYYTKDYFKDLILLPSDLTSGKYEIKEVKTDEIVPLSKAKTKFWDLYYNTAEIKKGKCYEITIGKNIYNGFCSYRNNNDITMVLYSDTGKIGAVGYEPTICGGEWSNNIKFIRFNKFPSEPDIIHNSITFGVIAKIDLKELKEDCVYFKELR